MNISTNKKFICLEIGRFVAAAIVMLYHYTSIVFESTKSFVLDDFFRPGHSGVPFFFVLSGFVIFFAHRKQIGKSDEIMPFIGKRILRLMPMFLLVSLAMLFGLLFLPAFADQRTLEFGGVIADLLLLPHHDAILGVSWTLRHEMLFYALFIGIFYFGMRGLWVLALWIGLSFLGAQFPAWQGDLGRLSLIAHPLNLGFGLGIIVAMACLREVKRPWLFALSLTLGSSIFITLWTWEWSVGAGVAHNVEVVGTTGIVGYLVSAALLIYGFVGLEPYWKVPAPALMRILGGSSYTLYLIHQPFASVMMRLLPRQLDLSPTTIFMILALTAVACAIFIHIALEKPLLRFIGSMIPRKATQFQTKAI